MANSERLLRFMVWCPALGQSAETGREVHGVNANHAAVAWAREFDAAAHGLPIANGRSCPVVCVMPIGVAGATAARFQVTGVMQPSYFTTGLRANLIAHEGICGQQHVGPDGHTWSCRFPARHAGPCEPRGTDAL